MKKALNSGMKIHLGGLSALKDSLTTAKSYNSNFEGVATTEEVKEPPRETPKPLKESFKELPPKPQEDSKNPEFTVYQKPQFAGGFNSNYYEKKQESFKNKQEYDNNRQKPQEPFKKPSEPFKKALETFKKPIEYQESYKKAADSPRYHDEFQRFSKGFDHERPKKNRSFSPQPQREHIVAPENIKPAIPPKDFRKKGLGRGNIEPDITIDMRTAENTSIFELNLSETTTKLLAKRNILNLFPLQVQAFEPIKKGQDFIGKAKTGTGKTMAFVLPLLERLREIRARRTPKVLVVSPTRELANQITDEFKYYGPEFRMVCCYGGVPLGKQIDMISRGLEIIVATPGRLLDLMGRRVIPLEHISTVVVDEADHMMDIGFKEDLDEILTVVNSSVSDLQLLLFSATIPPWIQSIVAQYIKPNKLFIDAVGHENQTADKIKHYAIPCTDEDLEKTLELVISYYANKGKALIFTDTKAHVAQLTARLENGYNSVGCLHGDMNQYSRDQTISAFKSGQLNCLIATDVAARGLDIPNVELVFQVRPPQNIANYIHRSGRTGRVNKVGISVIMYNPTEESDIIAEIEKKASIEFERRGLPTQEEFLELKEQLQAEIKQARLQDKEKLLTGRFRAPLEAAPRSKLEDCLDKLCQPQYFVTRSLLTGGSRKVTFLFVSNQNKKKYELKTLIESILEGVHIHTMAYTVRENGILVDVWAEQRDEVLKRIEKQGELTAKIPVYIPEHRFFSSQNNEGHSLNHGGREYKGRGGYGGGHQKKFIHKTNSTSSQLNSFGQGGGGGGKKPYTAFNFFVRNKKEYN